MNAGTPPDQPATVAGDVETLKRVRDSYAPTLDKAKQMLRMFTGRALNDDPNLVTIKSVLRGTEQNIAALTRAIAALQERDALVSVDTRTIANALYNHRYPRSVAGISERGHPSHDRIWAEADAVRAAIDAARDGATGEKRDG